MVFAAVLTTRMRQSATHILFNSIALFSIGPPTCQWLQSKLSRVEDGAGPRSTSRYEFIAFFIAGAVFCVSPFLDIYRVSDTDQLSTISWISFLLNFTFVDSFCSSAQTWGCDDATLIRSEWSHLRLLINNSFGIPRFGSRLDILTLGSTSNRFVPPFCRFNPTLHQLTGCWYSGTAYWGMVALDVLGLLRGWRLFDHAAHLGGAFAGIAYFMFGHHAFERFRAWMKGSKTATK